MMKTHAAHSRFCTCSRGFFDLGLHRSPNSVMRSASPATPWSSTTACWPRGSSLAAGSRASCPPRRRASRSDRKCWMWFFMRTSSSWISLRSASIAASCRMRSWSTCVPTAPACVPELSPDMPSGPVRAAVDFSVACRKVMHAARAVPPLPAAFFFAHLVQPLDRLLQRAVSTASPWPSVHRRLRRRFQAPGNFNTAFRSGSALTAEFFRGLAERRPHIRPPVRDLPRIPRLRSRLSVTSICPRCSRSFSTRRTSSPARSSSSGTEVQIEKAMVHGLQAQRDGELFADVRPSPGQSRSWSGCSCCHYSLPDLRCSQHRTNCRSYSLR